MKRESNFELLRIVAMFMIIIYHMSLYCTFHFVSARDALIVETFSMTGKIGVNLFVMITGYFGISSCFKLKKIIHLAIEGWFFSIGGLLLAVFFLNRTLTLHEIVSSFFPVSYNQYWFLTSFVLLYLLTPILNHLLLNLKKREYCLMLGVMLTLWSLLPTLTLFTGAEFNMTQPLWLLIVYMIGAYIKRFPNFYTDDWRWNGAFAFVSLSLIWLSVPAFHYWCQYFPVLEGRSFIMRYGNSIPAVIASVSLFCLFKNMNIKPNQVINGLSMGAFSVYLFHENYFIRPFLWELIGKNSFYTRTISLIGMIAISTVLIYLGGGYFRGDLSCSL